MDDSRRSFFRLPLAAVIASQPTKWATFGERKAELAPGPKDGDVIRPPAGALEVEIGAKIYHLYVWEKP
jgi:hypothetical protein